MVLIVFYSYLHGDGCSLHLPTWQRLWPIPTYMMVTIAYLTYMIVTVTYYTYVVTVAYPNLHCGSCILPIPTWC